MGFTRFLLLVFSVAFSVNCVTSCSVYRIGSQRGSPEYVIAKLPASTANIKIDLNPDHLLGTYISGVVVKACSTDYTEDFLTISYSTNEITITRTMVYLLMGPEIDLQITVYLTPVAPPFDPPRLVNGPLEIVTEK